jgi:hypothetical protein
MSSMNLESRAYISVYGEDMPKLTVTRFSTKQVINHDAANKRCQVICLLMMCPKAHTEPHSYKNDQTIITNNTFQSTNTEQKKQIHVE